MAIAFNTVTHGSGAAATSASFSVTAASSAGGTMFFAFITLATTASACTATYNGVAMTGSSANPASGNSASLVFGFYMKNAPSGANTLAFSWTGSSSWEAWAQDYTDTAASGTGVVAQNAFTTATTTASETLTPTVTNQWMVCATGGQGPDATATTNCTKRSNITSAQRDLSTFDSAANTLTSGSAFTMTQTLGGIQGNQIAFIFDIASSSAVASTHFLTLMGAGV